MAILKALYIQKYLILQRAFIMKPQNLSEASVVVQKKFLESFKYVLSDMDGVIWLNWKPLAGAAECYNYFEQIGKKIIFVTNNNIYGVKENQSKLKQYNFPAENVVIPVTAIIHYLKKINCNKPVFAIASNSFRRELKDAGFTLVENPPSVIEHLENFVQIINEDPDIGVVIFESDLNINRQKLQKALECLKRPDCLFISGACDRVLNIGIKLIGNAHFYQILADFSGREATQLAKPSRDFAEIIMNKFGIEKAEDVLFVGDSIDVDMGFAANAGFKKLLTLSGNATLDDIQNWKHLEEYKPEYYVENLQELRDIITKIYNVSK